MLSKEQAEDIKKQLLPQIDKLPNENKEQIKEYIQNLNEEELEEFLKQQNIQINQEEKTESGQGNKTSPCVFCAIVKNEIPSYRTRFNRKDSKICPLSFTKNSKENKEKAKARRH